ncbi:MAG: hypothetical protein ABH835_00575 [Patescibacteria group bacterium]
MGMNWVAWLLFAFSGFTIFVTSIVFIILLAVKKKFVVILLVCLPLLFIGCGLGGAATVVGVWNSGWWTELLNSGTNDYYYDDYNYNYNYNYNDNINYDSSLNGYNDYPDYASQGMLVNDYEFFAVDVGKEYVDYFTVMPVYVDSSFALASYAYCYDTVETYSDDMNCPEGYVTAFTIDVMDQTQYEAANQYGFYNLMYTDGYYNYVLSHPNGLLPSDTPTTDEFYNQVIDSFEFIQ